MQEMCKVTISSDNGNTRIVLEFRLAASLETEPLSSVQTYETDEVVSIVRRPLHLVTPDAMQTKDMRE